MSARLLIVDADPVQRRYLETTVNRFGYAAEAVENDLAARQRLFGPASADLPKIDLLILDIGSSKIDPIEFLGSLARESRRVRTIVQAAPGAIEKVSGLIRAGASDFIVKPAGAERILVTIQNALHRAALENVVQQTGRQITESATFADIVGASDAMVRVTRLGQKAAHMNLAVLLEGESGTGKEVVARAIHGESDRRRRTFVSVNCRALTPAAAWSVLFGHEKGHGPDERQTGKIVEARGGTIFLDEIGALPLEVQAALLRALQAGEIEPAGARRRLEVDVRFIVATTQNLIELVTRGAFREDLFYRLNVYPIAIPPLRLRRQDIADLARRFCARFAAELGKETHGLAAEAIALLELYDWPGNVRQLENALYRAVVLAETDQLTVAEFPQIAAQVEGFTIRIPPAPPPVAASPDREKEFVKVEVRDPNVLALLDASGRLRRLDRLEADAIAFALAQYDGQISAVARGLGIGRSTLYRKMRDYGLGAFAGDSTSADPRGANETHIGDAAA
jgi:DNA-binding NtrC family response regulator